MKKFILYTVIATVIAIAALATILILGNPELMEELPQRLALYHNTGNVTVTVNGEQIDLDGISINEGAFYEVSSQIEKVVTIDNNAFKFKEGSYGTNMFRFSTPVNEYGDVTVEFGHFNTNWWHEVHYDIELNLITNFDGSLTADIFQTVSYGGEEQFSHSKTDILDKTNSLISIAVCP
ncbi:MAG: hypothetical protein IJA60_03195 [Clostridia bacterium]|nr:hypothetical protein [Clostridia bacterium]